MSKQNEVKCILEKKIQEKANVRFDKKIKLKKIMGESK